MTEYNEHNLIFRDAIHARTRADCLQHLDTIEALFRDEYLCIRFEPKMNRNPTISLEWFAMLLVYDLGGRQE